VDVDMWQAVRQAITGQMKDFDRTLQQLMVHIDAFYLELEAVLTSFLWRVVQEHFSNPSADKIHRAKQEIESVKQVMLTNIGT
jgi:hypothetical protein